MRTFAILLCIVVPAHAQVVFGPHFEAERVDRYRVEATLELEQEGEEAGEARRLHQTVDVRLTTAQVDPSGRAIVSLAFERVDVELTEGDDTQRFTWPEGEDQDADLAAPWSMLVGDVLRVIVEPDGRIRAIEGAEAMSERFEMSGMPDAAVSLGLFAPGSLERTLRPIWGYDFSGEPRNLGDDWQVVERRVITGQRHIRLTRTHTLDAHDHPGASMEFTTSIEALPLRSPTQVNVTIDGQGEGSASWDIDRGITGHWREESMIVIEAALQDTDPITTRVSRQVRLTRLEAE